MFRKSLIALSMIALLLGACAAKAPAVAPGPMVEMDRGYSPEEPSSTGNLGAPGDASGQAEPERIVIKNASLSISVDDPVRSSDAIGSMAEEMGGFVVSAQVFQTSTSAGATVMHATLIIRVPVERLDEALSRIKAESTQPVMRENLTSEDVTAHYVDLQSRLRNAEAAETELAKYLTEAEDTEAVLSVYAQLKAVREEVEVLKGQIQYYDESAALSAISVELVANAAVQPISVGGWQPVGIAKDAIQALVTALQWLGGAAIWFIFLCVPLLLVTGLPLALIVTVVRRQVRKARKPVKVAPVAPPPDDPVR